MKPATSSVIRTGDVHATVDRPDCDSRGLAILAHGAGSDRDSVLLRTLSESLTARGLTVARIDLPYRQQRPKGPPSPSKAAADRDGIRAAIAALRPLAPDGPLIVGGQSYGGRQASMVVAEYPSTSSGGDSTSAGDDSTGAGHDLIADGLLLTSYPLHPPGKPEKSRVEHLPRITTPTLLVHGHSDAFATSAEIAAAAALFAGPVEIVEVEKADHGLKPERSGVGRLTAAAAERFFLDR
ncbi:alpha/beta hydrolase [Gordonia sp. PP30]|uniref:alpha/beta hydrolase family protein n=1 Tax=Gordonia sp. PP30 TaxID=2935861 RepID=UPI001FFEF35D|nr:alpha/beta family hydrolase [Gordonia sp. PP30]UQE73818.1 alpha/beta hydrolase [Gordonia sp. PP30]